MKAIILIVVGLALGYFGYEKYQESQASIKIGGIKISAGDSEGTTTSYVLMGLGAICFIGGLISLNKK